MNTLAVIGAALAGLAVALGAFAAHALESRLSERMLEVFQTGVRYQVIHAMAVLLVAAFGSRLDPAAARWAARLFVVGVIVFSGSLYVLALSGVRGFGAVTPLGGLAFLGGWVAFAVAIARGGE